MKLHLFRDDFEAILLDIAEREDIRADVLEKDYYVSLLLKELSLKQNDLKSYFKGGTALYKALSSINRFSEDIDLTVCTNDCTSNNQKKTRLEVSAKGYTSLERLIDDPENVNSKSSITSIYGYLPIIESIGDDPLQRFGRVKVEATSFTISEPVELMTIAPVVHTKANSEQVKILEDKFDVKPFELLTIKLERIFIDKIFAAEFYFTRYKASEHSDNKKQFAFDVSKHIYDLMFLHRNEKIQSLLLNESSLKQLISYKRLEEKHRHGGIPSSLPIRNFTYLHELLTDQDFQHEYNRMQEIYVFKESDIIPLSNAVDVISSIRSITE